VIKNVEITAVLTFLKNIY